MISNMTYDMMISSMIFIMFSSRKVAFDKCLTVEHYPSLHVLFKIQSGICTKNQWHLQKHKIQFTRCTEPTGQCYCPQSMSILKRRRWSKKYNGDKIGIFAIYLTPGLKTRRSFLTIIILIINHTGPTTIYNLDRYCYEYRSYVYRSW